MAGLMIGVGLLAYAVAGFIIMDAPTITQEIAGFLVATNATLFCVGGLIVREVGHARSGQPRTSTRYEPAPIEGTGRSVDSYADWAKNLTEKGKA